MEGKLRSLYCILKLTISMPILLGITVTVQIREKSAENSGKIRNVHYWTKEVRGQTEKLHFSVRGQTLKMQISDNQYSKPSLSDL